MSLIPYVQRNIILLHDLYGKWSGHFVPSSQIYLMQNFVLFPQKTVMFLIVIRQKYYFHTTLYNMWQLCAMDQFFLKFSITGSDKKNFSSPVTKSEVKENSFEKSHCQ